MQFLSLREVRMDFKIISIDPPKFVIEWKRVKFRRIIRCSNVFIFYFYVRRCCSDNCEDVINGFVWCEAQLRTLRRKNATKREHNKLFILGNNRWAVSSMPKNFERNFGACGLPETLEWSPKIFSNEAELPPENQGKKGERVGRKKCKKKIEKSDLEGFYHWHRKQGEISPPVSRASSRSIESTKSSCLRVVCAETLLQRAMKKPRSARTNSMYLEISIPDKYLCNSSGLILPDKT